MKLRNKIIIVIITILILSGSIITGIWYKTSSDLTSTYLENVSESAMWDAYHAFEYLLTDTSYMATMIAANTTNIIEPVKELKTKVIKENNQWNQTYLENRRIILDYINSIDGYKYYISGISIVANEECIFSANHVVQQKADIYDQILALDQQKLKKSVIMMEPMYLEGMKSTSASDYVVPAVRGIVDEYGEVEGFVIVYFDYSVIDQIFSANVPKGSHFRVVNDGGALIYSNRSEQEADDLKQRDGYVYNTFYADGVGWTFEMELPSSYYISGIRHTVLFTGIVIAVILIFAVLASVFLISRMTTQITVLRNKMREVSGGNLKVRYEVKENDEIGQMGRTFNNMVEQIGELVDKVALEEEQKRKTEMAFLQAQINPHFVSNVLNNVAWMAKMQHADNIVPLVNSLNALLRAVIHQDRELIPLSSELEYVDNYLMIMEYSGSFDFEVRKEITVNTCEFYIPRFILQPIIENAIYHGLPTDLAKRGELKLSASVEEGKLKIVVEDNGEGMSEKEIQSILGQKEKDKKSFNGVGVSNVNERIRLSFGKEYGLQYESEVGRYTRCIFKLPVIKGDENIGKN